MFSVRSSWTWINPNFCQYSYKIPKMFRRRQHRKCDKQVYLVHWSINDYITLNKYRFLYLNDVGGVKSMVSRESSLEFIRLFFTLKMKSLSKKVMSTELSLDTIDSNLVIINIIMLKLIFRPILTFRGRRCQRRFWNGRHFSILRRWTLMVLC